jgi:hypothetical protein
MTAIPKNIGDLLNRLAQNSATEMDAVQRLGDAIRSADDRMLEEVRSVTLKHEARRDAIFDELQHLAYRLCALPVRDVLLEPLPALQQPRRTHAAVTVDPQPTLSPAGSAGDWREATQRIDDEIDQYFGRAGPRH